MNPASNVPVINLIVGSITMQVFLLQTYGILWRGFTLWFMLAQYGKYKFNEINSKIDTCIKSMDSYYYRLNLLILAIRKHLYHEKMIKYCNYFLDALHLSCIT